MSLVYKALSDPTRREILQMLKQGELSAGDLAAPFDISKPAMSKHFKILKEADLIYSQKQGNVIYYGLNLSVLEEALMGFVAFFQK